MFAIPDVHLSIHWQPVVCVGSSTLAVILKDHRNRTNSVYLDIRCSRLTTKGENCISSAPTRNPQNAHYTKLTAGPKTMESLSYSSIQLQLTRLSSGARFHSLDPNKTDQREEKRTHGSSRATGKGRKEEEREMSQTQVQPGKGENL
jgi:hypothetical protein